MSVEAERQESIYEYLSPLQKVQGSHFIDKFDGDVLDSNRWTENNQTGVNTFQMSDGVNQGFEIVTQALLNAEGFIDFGAIHHYDFNGLIMIQETQASATTNVDVSTVCGDDGRQGGTHFFALRANSDEGFYSIRTRNTGSGASTTTGPNALNTNFNKRIGLLTSTAAYSFFNGVNDVSKTTDLPDASLQPGFMTIAKSASSRTGRIRMLEVFNTA